VRCTYTTAGGTSALQTPVNCVNLFNGDPLDPEFEIQGGKWVEIASKPMKLSNSQSVFVSPSLVSGLYTRTRTKTGVAETSTAEAMGAVYLRAVLVPAAGGDEIVAAPLNLCQATIWGCSNVDNKWGVVLDSRIQTLMQSLIECDVLIDGEVAGSCDFTSTIDLILKTASANTFNFIFPNVGQGTYTLKIYAAVGSGASVVGDGTAVGAAVFGLGSVTAETVRLVHGFDFQ